MTNSLSKVLLVALSGLIISSCGGTNLNTNNIIETNQNYNSSSWFSKDPVQPPLGNESTLATNNDVKLLVDGDEIFPEIYRIIDNAKNKIQVTTYIFGGKTGNIIANKLIEKKKQGVEIQFVSDPSMGTIPALVDAAEKEYKFLLKNGVEVRNFPIHLLPKGPSFLSNRKLINHSKMVIADEKVAVIGGMNFKESEAINHDYMIRIDGSASKVLSGIIDNNWKKSLPMKIKALDNDFYFNPFPPVSEQPSGTSNVEIAQTGFTEQSIDDMLLKHFDSAKNSIFIEMLLMDHHQIIESLANAAKRGVDVRVILDPAEIGKYNKLLGKLPLEGLANFGAIGALLDAKIPVKWYIPAKKDQMLHAKIALIDDETVITGSANYTYHALTRNHEVSVAVKNKSISERFRQVFEKDWSFQSKEAKLTKTQKLLGKLFSKVIKRIYKSNSSENEVNTLVEKEMKALQLSDF